MTGDAMRKTTKHLPKIVHRIWLNDGVPPPDDEVYWDAWRRQLPDFEFRTWRADEVASLGSANLIARARGIERKSQIACYDILFSYGGIFLEPGIAPYHRIPDELFEHALVVCSEIASDTFCSMGFIAAAPGAAALGWALDTLPERLLNERPASVETGPWLLRAALAHGEHYMLPPQAFYPYLADEPASAMYERDLSQTYGVRIWRAGRLDELQLRARIDALLAQGQLKETAELVAASAPSNVGDVAGFCEVVRAARLSVLEAAKHPLAASLLKNCEQPSFQLLKLGFFLLAQIPDLLVWQIGAADGVLAEPLRPLLVNFNAAAVLVEPHPQLFARLQSNYANNTRMKLVNAAVGSDQPSLALHLVDLDKAREHGLPDWALGMSSAFTERHTLGPLAGDQAALAAFGECLVPADATTVGMDDLLAQHGGAQPGIVVIDTEGMDYDIVMQLLAKEIRPFVLQFQRDSLPSTEVQLLTNALQREYVLLAFDGDVVAYRADVFRLYTEHLYVEHGIPTIYREALRFALHID